MERISGPHSDTAEALELIKDRAVKVTPFRRVYVALDPDDNLALECADECRAR